MENKKLRRLKENSYKYFTKEESLEAVKQNGYSLQFVKNQDREICLEAVKQNGDALRYVNPSIFDDMEEEMTLEEIEEELGKKIKIITKNN